MKKIIVLGLLFFSITSFSAKADEGDNSGFLSHYGVSLGLGTNGFNGNFHATIIPHLNARVGFNYLGFTYNKSITVDATDATTGIPMSGEFSNAKLQFPNANLLVDFYPAKDGVFSITAGLYFGINTVEANGKINNYVPGTKFDYGGVVIQPNADGTFNAKVTLGNAVKPYLGIGLGRTIPKHRVGFKFDLGVIYQGDYKVESDNAVGGDVQGVAEGADLPFNKNLLKLWPTVNFAITYKIK